MIFFAYSCVAVCVSVHERVFMCVSEHVWMGGGGAVCHISPQQYSRPFVVRVCLCAFNQVDMEDIKQYFPLEVRPSRLTFV